MTHAFPEISENKGYFNFVWNLYIKRMCAYMEKYNIPMGTLVEIQDTGLETDKKNHGVRLYVVGHHKDTIGKHLYSLGLKGETNGLKMYNGYYEEGLKIIDKISVELTTDELQDILQWASTCDEEGYLIDKELKLKDRLSKIHQ